MKTTIIYFDSYAESLKGLKRGLVGIIPILLLYYSIQKTITLVDFITAVLITSGMGVILYNSLSSALFFGFSIGALVALGRLNLLFKDYLTDNKCKINKNEQFKRDLLLTLTIPFVSGIGNSLVYYSVGRQ